MPASAAKAAPADPSEAKAPSGSQTLLRGLDLIDAVADRPIALAELASRLGLTRSTTHRLASALIDRRFLTFTPRQGYRLGPKLLELGFLAQQQADVVQIARDHIEALAAASEDTVHLGVRDHDRALYLDKIPGRRRVEISSRVGGSGSRISRPIITRPITTCGCRACAVTSAAAARSTLRKTKTRSAASLLRSARSTAESSRPSASPRPLNTCPTRG